MLTFSAALINVSAAVFTLMLDRRAQIAATVAFALAASVLLGFDVAEARKSVCPGGPLR